MIEHVADTAGWLSEVRRVLRPGGRLLLSTPQHGRSQLLRRALSARALRRAASTRAAITCASTRARRWRALLEDFGFEQIAVRRRRSGRPARVALLLASAVRSRF